MTGSKDVPAEIRSNGTDNVPCVLEASWNPDVISSDMTIDWHCVIEIPGGWFDLTDRLTTLERDEFDELVREEVLADYGLQKSA